MEVVGDFVQLRECGTYIHLQYLRSPDFYDNVLDSYFIRFTDVQTPF